VHPAVDNRSPFKLHQLHLADEDGLPVFAPLLIGTYEVDPGARTLSPAEDQERYPLEGLASEEVEVASYRYEPQSAFVKLATDIVLVGHAVSPRADAQFVDVGLKVGTVQKIVRVFGDRYWVKTGGQVIATKPQPFKKIPLTYERAFGGWDRSHKDKAKWRVELRNPVGRGYGDPLQYVDEGRIPMPNIEDPNGLIRRYGDSPPPAGFGFISPDWQPRARLAGTYDAKWDKERKPLLPKDFDRRFFNAASSGLIAPGYLRGDEEVTVVNAAAVTPLHFDLPSVSPRFRITLRNGKVEILNTNLDTLVVDTDAMLIFLFWRAYLQVPSGPHDVVAVDVAVDRKNSRAQ
jgi:hypothetical protein